MALTRSKLKWESRSAIMRYVKEAKRRGFTVESCRAKLDLEPSTQIASPTPQSLQTFDATRLCNVALTREKTQWETTNMFLAYVGEAKRRGFTVESCRAELGLEPLTSAAKALARLESAPDEFAVATLEPNSRLPTRAQRSFQEYLSGSKFTDFKAFAVDLGTGGYGRSRGYIDPTDAVFRALSECHKPGRNCILWAVGNTVVARMTPEQVEAVAALDGRENALGPAHPGMGSILNKLAGNLRTNENYAEAESLYMLALANSEKAIELGRWDERSLGNLTATTLENYAALLHETGRSAEANKMEARAKAIRAKHAEENPAD